MSNHWKPLLSLLLFTLLIRGVTASWQAHPRSMDEAYSYVNALTLATGGGLTENFIWNYLNPPDAVSHPGNLYWMPLTSFVAAIGLLVGGLTYDAAQLGFVVLSSLLPPLGYWLAWQVSGERRYGWVVGLMLVFSGFYFIMWTSTDNFTPFALTGALALYAAWRGLETKRLGWGILAGAMVGLAHLARADGPLLLIAIGLVLLKQIIDSWRTPESQRWSRLSLLGWVVIGYLLVMSPWFIRNWQLVGAPLPPGGSKTIWLQSYDDLFSYQRELSWQSYLAWGWGPIIDSKLWALGQNLQHLLAEPGMIFALPLALVGGWQQRKHPLFQLTFIYTLLLFAAMTLVFTFPGPRGAIFHSGGAILPIMLLAAVIGQDKLIEAIARRRRAWKAKTAKAVFSGGLVGLAIFLTATIALRGGLNSEPNVVYHEIIATLPDPTATVMIGNPPAFIYYGGHQAIIVPNEPLAVTLQIAERYGATYLVLDQNHPAPLRELFINQPAHPRLNLIATLAGPTYLYQILP